jgi:hypothetical protein
LATFMFSCPFESACLFVIMLLVPLHWDPVVKYLAGSHPRLLVLLRSTSPIPKLQDALRHSRPASIEPVFSILQQSAILAYSCCIHVIDTKAPGHLGSFKLQKLQHSRPAPIEPFSKDRFDRPLYFKRPTSASALAHPPHFSKFQQIRPWFRRHVLSNRSASFL